jgi:hypothetical protein
MQAGGLLLTRRRLEPTPNLPASFCACYAQQGQIRIDIFDLSGKLLKSITDTFGGRKEYSLKTLSNSVYLARITTDKEVKTLRIASIIN